MAITNKGDKSIEIPKPKPSENDIIIFCRNQMTNSKRTRGGERERCWTWPQIKAKLADCYNYDGHNDDWGVKVLYHETLERKLRARLYKLPAPKSNLKV